MNVKKLSLSVVAALALAAGPVYAEAEIAPVLQPEAASSIASDFAKLVKDFPSLVPSVAASMATSATAEDLPGVIAAILEAAPEQAGAIAKAMKTAGVDAAVITTAALSVPGIDPAVVAEATAAGGQTNTPPGQVGNLKSRRLSNTTAQTRSKANSVS